MTENDVINIIKSIIELRTNQHSIMYNNWLYVMQPGYNNVTRAHTVISISKHNGLRTFDVTVESTNHEGKKVMLVGEDGNGHLLFLKEKNGNG